MVSGTDLIAIVFTTIAVGQKYDTSRIKVSSRIIGCCCDLAGTSKDGKATIQGFLVLQCKNAKEIIIILAATGAIAIANAGTIETTTSTVVLQGVGTGTINTRAHDVTTTNHLNGI